MLQQKAKDSEKKPPALQATIKDVYGKDVDFIFNRTDRHFRFDVITIRFEDKEINVSRDDIAQVLLNAGKITSDELS